MIWVRKGVVLVLSLTLLVSLLGVALATSFNQTLGKPKKVESYLAQSRISNHFVTYVADQAAKSEGNDQAGTVSLSDAAVQAAAKVSFPSGLIQQGVNTFLDANYAWLEGKTTTPEFKVDFSAQKENFAERVGQVVKNDTAGLPVCATAQAAQQQISKDPLAATCRPKQTKPAELGAQVTERLRTTSDFLSNPVITASSVNPKGNQQSRPYYTKLSKLPKAYRAVKKSPYVFGLLAVLSALGIVFIAVTKRRGVRRIGEVLAVAGVVLVALKPAAAFALKKTEDQIFNNGSVGPLQQSLSNFGQRVESAMVRADLWFGLAFLVLALIVLVILLRTRRRSKKDSSPSETAEPEERRLPMVMPRKRLRRPFGESIMPLGAKPGGDEPEAPEAPAEPQEGHKEAPSAAPEPSVKPKRRKRPRLIQ